LDLFYRKYGQGDPVIILHGLFGMSDNWASIGKRISENGYSVYIPDLRNHGNSPHSDDLNYEILSNDLSEFINKHLIKNPIIIGHSLGGKIAMNFALENPADVKKLIVVDIGTKEYPVHNIDVLDAFLSIDITNASSRNKVEEQIAAIMPLEKVRQLMMKNIYRRADNRFEWKLNIESINNNFSNIFDKVKSKNKFTNPTLFIKGELSNYISTSDFPEIKDLFPNAELQMIQGATHWVHADKPGEFIDTVLKFIKD
jgi:esterase